MLRTERKLVERVLKGDSDSFNLLVRQWEKPIYNFILRFVGDKETADATSGGDTKAPSMTKDLTKPKSTKSTDAAADKG